MGPLLTAAAPIFTWCAATKDAIDRFQRKVYVVVGSVPKGDLSCEELHVPMRQALEQHRASCGRPLWSHLASLKDAS